MKGEEMDQQKIGTFLRKLRREKELTQEQLAEKMNVSSRTVSRWETGVNMPDLSILVELAEFYDVSIPEIIDGERKSESMNPEVKETAVKMAEYGKHEMNRKKRDIISAMLGIFGIGVIISAFGVFPRDSSWGSIYATFGGILLLIGIGIFLKKRIPNVWKRGFSVAGCAVLLAAVFLLSDYIGVAEFHQPPRFCYAKEYTADGTHESIVYKTPLYNVALDNPDSKDAVYVIVKR